MEKLRMKKKCSERQREQKLNIFKIENEEEKRERDS
jgi:hypothetical protein